MPALAPQHDAVADISARLRRQQRRRRHGLHRNAPTLQRIDHRPQFIEHRLDSPSHGIGVSPDNKTLWITSIPQNAVFVYDLADLKLKGHVDLPTINVAGRKPMSTVANWVTFTPDGKQIYVSNAANNTVTAIDTAAMKINAVIPVGQAPKRVGTVVTQ